MIFETSYDSLCDISDVPQIEPLSLTDCMTSGIVPNSDDVHYNEIDSVESVGHRVEDVFDGMRTRDAIRASAKAEQATPKGEETA